jgi:hypothetical protein
VGRIADFFAAFSRDPRRRMPRAVEPNENIDRLAEWARLPVRPDAARWRGRPRASSGRRGVVYYQVHALLDYRGARWSDALAAIEQLPLYRDAEGVQFWHELVSPALMPLIDGENSRIGIRRDARSLWANPRLDAGPHSWIAPLGDGPHVLLAMTSASQTFGSPRR